MSTLLPADPVTAAHELAAVCSGIKAAHPILLDWRVLDHGFHLDLLMTHYSLRGNGHGDRALAELCAAADQLAVAIRLDAADCMGADIRRLLAWYSRRGFVLEPSRTPEDPRCIPMVRHPHLPEAA